MKAITVKQLIQKLSQYPEDWSVMAIHTELTKIKPHCECAGVIGVHVYDEKEIGLDLDLQES